MNKKLKESIEVNHVFDKAESIEEILCLSVLIATGELPYDSNLYDANEYYKKIGNCDVCPYYQKCLACIINE